MYGIYLAVNIFQQHGPAMALARSQSWFLFATILLILLAAYFIFRILIALQRIQLFEGGLKLHSFSLRQKSLQWKDLSGISSSATRLTFFGKPMRTTPTGKIFPMDGRPIDLSKGFLEVPYLIKMVKSKIYPLVWPQIKSALRSGRSTLFGPVIVNRDFLEISNRSVPWQSINRLHTEAGFLVVELHDNSSRKVPTIDIPNLELLLKAVDWGIQ